jgi:hypothetical protein
MRSDIIDNISSINHRIYTLSSSVDQIDAVMLIEYFEDMVLCFFESPSINCLLQQFQYRKSPCWRKQIY